VPDHFHRAARPDPAVLPCARRVDLGPDADRGIGHWPARLGAPYVDLVCAVDDDGNEVGGVRLPAVAAPLAAYTGWNPRRHVDGLPEVLYERLSSKIAFPPGRMSVTERYPTRDDYAAAARTGAEHLVAQRFLLPEDFGAAVQAAMAAYR
jgi:Alpha/beta hydrolase domain